MGNHENQEIRENRENRENQESKGRGAGIAPTRGEPIGFRLNRPLPLPPRKQNEAGKPIKPGKPRKPARQTAGSGNRTHEARTHRLSRPSPKPPAPTPTLKTERTRQTKKTRETKKTFKTASGWGAGIDATREPPSAQQAIASSARPHLHLQNNPHRLYTQPGSNWRPSAC